MPARGKSGKQRQEAEFPFPLSLLSVHNLVFQNLVLGKFMDFLHEQLYQVLFPSVPGKSEWKFQSAQTIQCDKLFGVPDIFVL